MLKTGILCITWCKLGNSERLNMFFNIYQGYFSKQTRVQIYGHSLQSIPCFSKQPTPDYLVRWSSRNITIFQLAMIIVFIRILWLNFAQCIYYGIYSVISHEDKAFLGMYVVIIMEAMWFWCMKSVSFTTSCFH